MDVSTALLADAASVRENLLFVLGGGVTRVRQPQVPAPMGVVVALMLQVHRTEIGRLHELIVEVIDQDGTTQGRVQIGFQVPTVPAGLDVHEDVVAPFVADLRNLALPDYGTYSVEIAIDGQHRRTLPFQLVTPPGPPAIEPPAA